MMSRRPPPSAAIDPRLMAILCCPRCRGDLTMDAGELRCNSGHRYPVVDGVPVFILAECEQTIGLATASYRAAHERCGAPLYIDTLAISEAEKEGVIGSWSECGALRRRPWWG